MDLLNNPWVIGIGGGILSGLLVTLITRHLFSRRDNREYLQKVVTANQEVVYAIRPGISEGVIPSQDIIDSLIRATSKKYAVDHRDLHNAPVFADVLIKEVMDSSFLSASTKTEFCRQLAQLKPTTPLKEFQAEPPSPPKSTSEIASYRRRMVTMMSAMLGVMAALMTITIAFYGIFEGAKTEIKSKEFILIVPTALTIFAAFMVTYITWVMRFLERKKKERLEDSRKSGDDSGKENV